MKLDRTAWIAIIICAGLMFFFSNQQQKKVKEWNDYQKELAEEEAKKNPPAPENSGDDPTKPGPENTEPAPENGTTPDKPAEPAPEKIAVETHTLSNDKVIYHFTNKGAGISVAELRDYNRYLQPKKKDGDESEPTSAEEIEKVELNQSSPYPIGALSTGPKEIDETVWSVLEKSDTSITYVTEMADKIAVSKTFTLASGNQDPYEINLRIDLQNNTGEAISQTGHNRFIYLGATQPLSPHEWSMQLGIFWKNDEGKFYTETVDHFADGWFSSEKPHDTFVAKEFDWAGVHGQFFSTMIKAGDQATGQEAHIWGSRILVDAESKQYAPEAAVSLPSIPNFKPGESGSVGETYRIFTGPKQFDRLKSLGSGRERAMAYDKIPIFGWIFGWAIKPLASWLTMGLHWIESAGVQWGVAIILITLVIRILIWPVYAKSARTMKRMSKLTPKMKEIREKYKDDPQKMNQETMGLYSKYGVNPLGGCLPMFIQLPVFLAFYRMLWSEVDLRHESFLWVDDLSMPDTQWEIPFPFFGWESIPVNPLPLIMALTTFIQMSMTPKTGDKTQRMIFMLLPFIFLFICYNFAAALSLYWTTQNIFSIFQTWLMNKLPEPELKPTKKKKKGFMARLQEQAEAQQKARKAGGSAMPSPGQSRTKMPSEKGERHTKGKKKRK